jgi:hypothetical protein
VRGINWLFARDGAGQPEPLFTIDPAALSTNHWVASFDVSADDSRFGKVRGQAAAQGDTAPINFWEP